MARVGIEDRGHLKALTIVRLGRERLLICEFMEAELGAPPARASGTGG